MAKQNITKWDALSMKDRASFIRVGIKNGITDLEEIREEYNKYADGGEKEIVYAGYIPEVNIIESNRKLPNPNTPKGRNQSKFYADRISKGDMHISGVPKEYRDAVLNYLKSKSIEAAARDRKGYEKLQEFAMAASGGLPGIVGDLASRGAIKFTDYGLDLLNTPEDSKFRDYAKFIAALGAGAYVGGKTAWYDPGAKENLITTMEKAIETTSDAISGVTKTIASPQYRRNHAFYTITPTGYDKQFSRIKDYISSMLLDKPIDIEHPSWYSEYFSRGLSDYLAWDAPKLLPGNARVDAWRIYNNLPQKFGTYIKNPDGTYSYDIFGNEAFKSLRSKKFPLKKNPEEKIDYITGAGGNLQGNAGTILGSDNIRTYELRTIKDTWDLHPFSRQRDQFSKVLGKSINKSIKNTQQKVQNFRNKMWDLGIFGMPYRGVLPKITQPIDAILNRFRMKDFQNTIDSAINSISGMKNIDRVLSNLEIGKLYGGKPFTMITDVPITWQLHSGRGHDGIETVAEVPFFGINNPTIFFKRSIPEARLINRKMLTNDGPRRFDTIKLDEDFGLDYDVEHIIPKYIYNKKFQTGGTINNEKNHLWTIDDATNVIKQFEGYRNKAYQLKDGNGNAQWLGGYGHALTPEEIKLYSSGTVIPDSTINAWLNKDIESKRKNIKTFYGDNIPEHAEALLLSLAYQGGDKLIRGARESDNTDGKGWSPNFEKTMIRYIKNPSKTNTDAVIDQMQYRDDVLGQGKDGLTSRYGLYRAMLDGTADPKRIKEYYDKHTFRHYRSNKAK